MKIKLKIIFFPKNTKINQLLLKILVKNILVGGGFCRVYGGKYIDNKTLIEIKAPIKTGKSIINETNICWFTILMNYSNGMYFF